MDSSPLSEGGKERAAKIQKALSEHDYKALRRLMRDKTRKIVNPKKFNIDNLPDYPPVPPVTDRRKRRKVKAEYVTT